MTTSDWHEVNQRYLAAALALVAESLEPARGDDSRPSGAAAELERVRAELPAPAALEHLCDAVGLSRFERDVLLLAAGVELDSGFAARVAATQGGGAGRPTFSLALAVLPDPHWSALAPAAPLRRWRLVELGAGDTLASSPLRVDERVLHYLAGVGYLDERLQGVVSLLPEPPVLAASHRAIADRVAALWRETQPPSEPLVQLLGGDPAALRDVAAAACAAAGVRPFTLRAQDVPQAAAERDAFARLWEREVVLAGMALVLECEEGGDGAAQAPLTLAETLGGPVLLLAREPLVPRDRVAVRFDVAAPPAAERRTLWTGFLGERAAGLGSALDALVAQFELGAQPIAAACTQALSVEAADGDSLADALWDACRAQARTRLDELAQRIETTASWDDLVLPKPEREVLEEIGAHVRRRTMVYETWGFAGKGTRGLGISALFVGSSGTGKTTAAEVLARELRLDLYRIDLSQVVSKYIGETEKNLRRVFDAAESGGAILLFDEADALFGKRSEVKDSHDRYANIEVSYLLQRMEAYRGLAILTTNRKEAVDDAFLRRIRFVVRFPFPDEAHRAEIWRRIFPADAPTDDLDAAALARLSIPGGNIRNIALHASFLAADAGESVGMAHLLRAARREYAKLDRPLTAAETGGWR